VIAARAGHAGVATVLALRGAALAMASRRSLRLAERSRVGAASEARVRRALRPLEGEGWHVRHSLEWPGPGDLDHVVRAPSGVGFLIETKTLRFTRGHLERTGEAARWVGRRRRRYPRGVHPVICLARARAVERVHDGVLIVSLDRMVAALRRASAPRRDANVISGRASRRVDDVRRVTLALRRRARRDETTRNERLATRAVDLTPDVLDLTRRVEPA
jgi:Nuclease-related domain